MRVFIGLDGGGTGCRAQAELQDGRRTDVLTGGAANIATEPQGALQEIDSLLTRVLAQAQALLPQGALPETFIVLGLAGAVETRADATLRTAVPHAGFRVCGDIEIALNGALEGDDGIVLAVGTGSVVASQFNGDVRRLGGYGLALGDEGSGAWLGREALRASLQARDGLAADGPLVQEVWRRFSTLSAIIGFAARAHPADYATLAPLVISHDRAQCPVAGRILDQGCAYLVRAIRALQPPRGGGLPVVPMGSLGAPLLHRILGHGASGLRERAPRGNALDGALSLARRSVGQAVSRP